MKIIANLHNMKTDRFHPILFGGYPLARNEGPGRFKSIAHHTIGFDTREESIAECRRMSEDPKCGGTLCVDKDFAWDGEVTPAMVVFFIETDEGIRPAF